MYLIFYFDVIVLSYDPKKVINFKQNSWTFWHVINQMCVSAYFKYLIFIKICILLNIKILINNILKII